jgi:hypothetical protein
VPDRGRWIHWWHIAPSRTRGTSVGL